MERKPVSKRLTLNRDTVRVLTDSGSNRGQAGVHILTSECTPLVLTIPVDGCLSRVVYPC